MVLGKLPVPGRPTIWMIVGQGPIVLAVGAGGGCLDIFTLLYPFSQFLPSLWETARYRLKYCLKGPLNPKQQQQQLSGTKAYEQTSEKEKSVINNHIFCNATRFAVSVNEDQERLPTFYWLPKLHKNHIRFDLLIILAHARLPNYQNYLPLVLLLSKTMLLNIVKISMNGPIKIFFGQSKIHVRY